MPAFSPAARWSHSSRRSSYCSDSTIVPPQPNQTRQVSRLPVCRRGRTWVSREGRSSATPIPPHPRTHSPRAMANSQGFLLVRWWPGRELNPRHADSTLGCRRAVYGGPPACQESVVRVSLGLPVAYSRASSLYDPAPTGRSVEAAYVYVRQSTETGSATSFLGGRLSFT